MLHNPISSRSVPLALKVAASAFFAVLFPVYWYQYGLLHFFWISDVALFITIAALWRESRLLNSVALLLALPFELGWMVDFFVLLIAGIEITGLAAYMFDPEMSLFLRGLSLFHVPMPIIWVWLLFRWGYDPRALKPALCLFLVVILASYGLTEPEKNINWVFGPQVNDWGWISQPLWLALYLLVPPLLWFWPAHAVLERKLPFRA